MLEKLVGQSCSGCKQLFTEHSLLAEPGRPVVVDMQNDERPVLYTCVVCTYFYARHDCWYDKENISRPFFAPLNQSGARTMIYKLVGPFREEPRIVVVIPTVEAL